MLDSLKDQEVGKQGIRGKKFAAHEWAGPIYPCEIRGSTRSRRRQDQDTANIEVVVFQSTIFPRTQRMEARIVLDGLQSRRC
jgi:hypothetical protein